MKVEIKPEATNERSEKKVETKLKKKKRSGRKVETKPEKQMTDLGGKQMTDLGGKTDDRSKGINR